MFRQPALIALLTSLCSVPLPAAAASVAFLDYTAPLPDCWTAEAPSSSMRQLQYRVRGEAGNAQFIVYYFGPGQGGSATANIARWQSQFTGPDGGPVTPAVETFTVNDWPVTLASFAGSYARGIGSGPQGRAVPDQVLLAAVIETPRGPVIVQLFGAAATVREYETGFRGFVTGIRER